jgi:hypothetical protein
LQLRPLLHANFGVRGRPLDDGSGELSAMRHALVRGVVAMSAAATCLPSGRPAESMAPIPIASATEAAAAPASASAFPSAAPSVTAAATPSATPSTAAAPPLPIRATTPGKIACETVDCDLRREICCVVEANDRTQRAECAPRVASASGDSPCCPHPTGFSCGNNGLTIDRSCDEASDCPPGQDCCVVGPGEGDHAGDECGTMCAEQRCLPGSTCPNGNLCAAGPGATRGTCPLQIKPASCGGATCRAGQVCCWDGKRPRCGAACNDGEMTLECTGPEQCKPHACNNMTGIGAGARFQCGGAGFTFGVVCRTARDCPDQISSLGFGPAAPHLTGCSQTAGLPPGVKTCDYQ